MEDTKKYNKFIYRLSYELERRGDFNNSHWRQASTPDFDLMHTAKLKKVFAGYRRQEKEREKLRNRFNVLVNSNTPLAIKILDVLTFGRELY